MTTTPSLKTRLLERASAPGTGPELAALLREAATAIYTPLPALEWEIVCFGAGGGSEQHT